MRTILIGMSIFKQYSVTLEIRKQVIHFPERPLQLRNGKYNGNMCELRVAQKIVLPPNKQNTLARCIKPEIGTTTGTAEASKTITRRKTLLFTPGLIKLEKSCTQLQFTNPHDHTYTINAGAILANFTVLTPNQAKYNKPVAPQVLSLLTQHPDDATARINQLLHDEPTTTNLKWYSTPETCHEPRPSDAQPTGKTHLRCYCQPETTREIQPDDIRSTAPDVSQLI